MSGAAKRGLVEEALVTLAFPLATPVARCSNLCDSRSSIEGMFAMQATRGAVVSLNYTLTDDNGAVIDSSEDGAPLQYLHGYDNIIPGLERALEGADVGHKSVVVVEAADGYGEVDTEAIFEVERDKFPEGVDVFPGMQFAGETPNGDVPLTVMEVTEGAVIVDANHPLAGQTLHFDVEVVDVRPASNEELAAGYPQC